MENIIIIGNGGSNLDKKNGKEIDKFTKVVRLGQFHLDGYEDYVGKKTDIISTSHWKLNRKRLAKTKTIICVPFYSKESYKENELFVNSDYKDLLRNILYIDKQEDYHYIWDNFKSLNPPFESGDVNFSLGFKTIFLIMKLFPGSKITVTGFDFFLTGWYWKKDHNRDIANCHPYIYEKLYLKRMIIDKTIHLL
tara:strand:+ start:2302 stop:2883 length:582 start_codon:yes stop_codon:yes gene_type:complete